jgi:hypothetical protein
MNYFSAKLGVLSGFEKTETLTVRCEIKYELLFSNACPSCFFILVRLTNAQNVLVCK